MRSGASGAVEDDWRAAVQGRQRRGKGPEGDLSGADDGALCGLTLIAHVDQLDTRATALELGKLFEG